MSFARTGNPLSAAPSSAPSLVPVAIGGILITIAMSVIGWQTRHDEDPESVRFLALAFSGPALTAFGGTGFAYVRGYRGRELGWLIPGVFVMSAVAVAPLAYAAAPTAGSVALAALGVAIALAIGGLAFGVAGVPVTVLLRAAFARLKPPTSHVWWSVAALIFVASFPAVGMAIEDVDAGTTKGRGLLIWLRILGFPIGEVNSEAALWLTRLLVALAVVPGYLGYRAHKRENPPHKRRAAGRGRRKRENRYARPDRHN